MSDQELRQSFLSDCAMSAQDCKGSADYAAYAFSKGDEAQGREYVTRLEENLQRLKTHLSLLANVTARIRRG